MDEDIFVIDESDDSSQSEHEFENIDKHKDRSGSKLQTYLPSYFSLVKNSQPIVKKMDVSMTSIRDHSPTDFLDSQLPESPDQKNSNDIEVISVSDSESDSDLADQIAAGKLNKKKGHSSKSSSPIKNEIGKSILSGQHRTNKQSSSQIKKCAGKPKKRKLSDQSSHSHDKDWKQTKLDTFKTDHPRLSLDSQLPVITKDHKKGVKVKNKHNTMEAISTPKQSHTQNKVSNTRATSPDTIKLFSSSADSAEEAIEEIDSRSDSDVSLSEYERGSAKPAASSSKVSIKEIPSKKILHKLKSKEISTMFKEALTSSLDRNKSPKLSQCKKRTEEERVNSFQSSSEEDLTESHASKSLDKSKTKANIHDCQILSHLNETPSSSKVSIKEIPSKTILHKLKSKKISTMFEEALSVRQTSNQDRNRFSRLSLCKNKKEEKKVNYFHSSSEEDLTQKLILDSWDDNHNRPRSQSPSIFSGSDTEVQELDKDATIPYEGKTIDRDATILYMNKSANKDPFDRDKEATLSYKDKTSDKDATLPYMDSTVDDSENSLTQAPSLSPVDVLSVSESDSSTDDNVPLLISINKKADEYCKSSNLETEHKKGNILVNKKKTPLCDSKNKLVKKKEQLSCGSKKISGKTSGDKNILEQEEKQSSSDLEEKPEKEKDSRTTSLPETDDESTQEPDYSLLNQTNPSEGLSSFHSLVPSKDTPELSSDDSLPDCDFLTQPSPVTEHLKSKLDHKNKSDIKSSENKIDPLGKNCLHASSSKNLSMVSVSKNVKNTTANIERERDVFKSVLPVLHNAKSNKNTKMQVENEPCESTEVNAPSTSSNKQHDFQENNDQMTDGNDPSPIFRRSKPINLQDDLPWLQSPVPKKTPVTKTYSPSSNIFEKMAASSQALLKESQIEDDHVMDDEEMIQVPVLNLNTSDSNLHPEKLTRVIENEPNIEDHLEGNGDNLQKVSELCNDIKKENNTNVLMNSGLPEPEIPTLVKVIKKEKDAIDDGNYAGFSDLPKAVSEIKKEMDEDVTVKYTQDDDDVIDVFDSDDEEALFAMSQVQVSFKAEPLSDNEDADADAEDDLSAMAEMYLKNLNEDNIEPRTKAPKLTDGKVTSRATEPLTEDVDFFHDYYMKDGPWNAVQSPNETTSTQRVARPSTPVDSQLDSDEEFLSHVAKIGSDLGKENEKETCQKLNETSIQKQISGSTVAGTDNADKDEDIDIFKLFDSDSDAATGDDACYNEKTLLDETEEEGLDVSGMKKVNRLDSFEYYNQSTILEDESDDDSKDLQSRPFSVTDHARNLIAQQETPGKNSNSSTTLHLDKIKEKDSKKQISFETVSDEELFNLMSEAGGIQSPGKIVSYSPKLKSKISDKLVPDKKLSSDLVSNETDSNGDEASMDDSDIEIYFAATQQVPEDDFDYDFGTQVVDTSDKSTMSTNKFYSHGNLKQGPKKLVEIEPRRQESRKEIRDKFKKSIEVFKKMSSEQKQMPSTSSAKISNLSKISSASKPSSSATRSIPTSSKLSGSGSVSKNVNKSDWMNSLKRKYSPQKKPVKKQRQKTKNDDSFSFTQKIGIARKQMKHRKKMPDAPKIPSAKYTKCRNEEAVIADTCSDVELPNMSQIIDKQLPIITCDINEMKRNREKQKREEQEKTRRKEETRKSTSIPKEANKVNMPSSSKSSGGNGTFVKPKSMSSSSRSSSDKPKNSSSSSKSSHKDQSTKKSLCIDKVNENRKLSSKKREDRTDSSSVKGNSGASKKSIPATKGVSVVDKSERGGMLLDDLINKLGPIDRPLHLPFSAKHFPDGSTRTVSEKAHSDAKANTADSNKERYTSVRPSSSDKSSLVSRTNKMTGLLNTNNQPNHPSANILLHQPMTNNLSDQSNANYVSDQPSSSHQAMAHVKDPRIARGDPRITCAGDIRHTKTPTSNLMLKPTTTVNVGTSKENTGDNVTKLFTSEDYFKLILNWNPVWLNEQDKMSNSKEGLMPPILGKNDSTFPLLESYSNVEEYQKILLNLMVLETWEMVFRDWKEKHEKKKAVILNVGLERIQVDKEFITLTWKNILPEGLYRSGKFPREGDLVRVNLWGAVIDKSRMKEGQEPQSKWLPQMGYVESVKITQNQPLDELCARVKSLRNDPLCKGERVTSITVVTKLKYRKFSPIGNRLMSLEVLSCLVTNIRQISALAYLHRSRLSKELLKPGNDRVYVHGAGSTKNSLNEFDASQADAIKRICSAIQQPDLVPRVCILQGPPGTGKSHTIVGLINAIISSSETKICICLATPSNAAADELMRRLKKDKLKKRQNDRNTIKFVRIGNIDNMHADVKDYCLDILYGNNKEKELKEKRRRNLPDSVKQELKRLEDRIHHLQQERCQLQKGHDKLKIDKCQIDLNKHIQKQRKLESQSNLINQHERLTPGEEYKLKKDILLKADVICGTLSSFGNPRVLDLLKYDGKNVRKPFNCLIIDEASQAAEIDCLIPLQYGMSKIILVGDPEQLPATVLSKKAGEMNFGQSLLERLYNYFQHNNPRAIIMLKTQYRMDKDIFSFPNRLVYNGQLNTHQSVDQVCKKFPLKPYLVFDMECGKETVNGSAICNMVEAQCTVELCLLLSGKIQPSSIGVICPYQSQKALVVEELRVKKLDKVEVGTVDGFQGREKLVIILTCVRAQSLTGSIGFLADRRRMNVALTRAKNALYILGHVTSLQRNADWKLLIEDAIVRNVVKRVENQNQFSQVAKYCFK